MSMSVGSPGRQKAEINMTPMIDVLLVLIIIFMVITPIASRGLRTLLPQTASETSKPPVSHEIVVTVRTGHAVLLNQEELELSQLQERLLSLFKNGAADVVFIRGEKGLEFGRVMQVIDLARGAGVTRVALMTT